MRLISALVLFIFSVPTIGQKINGISLVSPPKEIGSEKMAEVKRINADWAAIIPYAFSRAGEPAVTFDHERQWWGERTEGVIELIRQAKTNDLKIMLKPHVWVVGQGWTGDFDLHSEADWKTWEAEFANYILHYAHVADSLEVDVFCIGTEYRTPAVERPQFWIELAEEVKKVYTESITYASNWDNFQNIIWWDQVDYLGIDAYFPLVEVADPSEQQIIDGWEERKEILHNFHQKWKKPVLFTEYGFQSVDGACGKHWEVDKSEDKINYALQARAFDATFQCFMKEDWYAGGFLWKWHFYTWEEDRLRTEWTPQNKPAEQIIAWWYGKRK